MSIRTWRSSKRIAAAVAAAAVGASLLALPASPAGAVTPVTTGNRIEGTTRYGTSAALATRYIAAPGISWNGDIVVAAGDNFPDALAAASIAKVKTAPILLVPSNGSMPSEVRDWLLINRANILTKAAPTITVVGGEAAVPAATVTTMLGVLNQGLTTPKVTSSRISGADRYSTAAAVAAATGVLDSDDNAILVSGENFADAVSTAPLANAKDWPIILTNSNSLNASAKTALAALQAKNANAKVYIVGGPAAVSYGVEEELVLAGFKYSNIVRIGGVDRYQTSLLVNVAMTALTPAGGLSLASPQFSGAHVALVTGENFADAVAAAPFLAASTSAGIHLQLTKSSELSASAAGLISTLATLGAPATLYAIGGTNAIAANTLAGAVAAAQSTNMVGTMMCLEGMNSVSITFAKALDATEQSNLNGADIAINGASNVTNAAATFSNLDTTATFTLATTVLKAGDVVTFGGNSEALSLTKRTLTAGACTVADDAVGPTVTITAVSNSASNFFVSSNEPLAAIAGSNFTLTNVDPAVTVSAITSISPATAPNTLFLATLSANTVTTGATIALAAGAVKDIAGNNSAATSTTVGPDTTVPTFTVTTVSLPVSQSAISAGGVTLSAKATGAFDGKAGNGWKLSVVNQRGLVLPTVVADATAKTVVVTADIRYSDAADVAQFVLNRNLLAGWTLSGGGANTLTATTTPGTTIGGNDLVTIVVTASEFMSAGPITSVSAVLNGASIALTGGGLNTNVLLQDPGRTVYVGSYLSAVPGTLSLTWASALDVAGNNGFGTFTGTIS